MLMICPRNDAEKNDSCAKKSGSIYIPLKFVSTRLVLIVTNAQDGSSIHADCFYYYQESNAVYLDPYNLQCLTPQG